MSGRIDLVSLIGGLVIALLGSLLLLEIEDAVELGGWLVPALVAATGLIFVASGLGARGR